MVTPASTENTAASGARGALATAESVAFENCLKSGANYSLQRVTDHTSAYGETVLIALIPAPLSLKLAGRLTALERTSVSALCAASGERLPIQ